MKNTFHHLFYPLLENLHFHHSTLELFNLLIWLVLLILILFISDFVTKKIALTLFNRFASKTKTNFDDQLVKNKVPENFAHLIPVFITYELYRIILEDFSKYIGFVSKTIHIILIVLLIRLIRSVFFSIKEHLKTIPQSKDKPIDSYIQVGMIIVWTIGLLSVLGILTEVPFMHFITTLGAASAVILLVFKDTILGFVASIQVSVNDMVRIGDWVTFEKFGADGDVIEINLVTVKVQNFDNTITTIPTYFLISDSFKNWRGMTDSPGRRIKRSILIKQSGVRFLKEDQLAKYKQIELIHDYLVKRETEINAYNKNNEINKEVTINGRNLTNLGIFRKYTETYVNHHSAINKDLMIMVRQLQPTPQGIPIEVYAFSSDKRWENYEYIMADIFDHVLASVSYFDLEVFEYSSDRSFELDA